VLSGLLKQERIAITAIQETHLNDQLTEQANARNPNIVVISNSEHTNKEGVAFIINKRELNTDIAKYEHDVLIPNRASRLTIEWGTDNKLDLINVYAPNDINEKIEFLKELKERLEDIDNLENPILMGDWNFVEEAMDRSPMHDDDNRIKEAFRAITQKYKLIDGWRTQNPDSIGFTFTGRDSGSMSRIDRAYVSKEAYLYTVNWGITPSGTISDHDLVTINILKKGIPYVGGGMKKLNTDLMEYSPFIKECALVLYKAQNDIMSGESNIQKTWDKLQTDILNLAGSKRKQRLRELDKKYNRKKNRVMQAL
ncbi:Endonuclease/exonuclease/phosphatase, partial [Ganoderma leucocontextum]